MIISGNSSINNVYYSGYTISKIYACGGSLVWSGDTPTVEKFTAIFSDSTSYSAECDGNTTLTYRDTTAIGYPRLSGMTDITIGDCVTSIGNIALGNIANFQLSSVTMSSNVTSIGKSAFYADHNLSRINSNTDGLFDLSNILSFGEDSLRGTNVKNVILNDNANFGISVFHSCPSLEEITLPASMTAIPNTTFVDCTSLSSVTIPSGVTSIGTYVFENCRSLSNLTIPTGVTSIDDGTFKDCINLERINSNVNGVFNIPSGVTRVNQSCFRNCYKLETINIPSDITIIGDDAFAGCSGLTNIDIPTGVTIIENYTFSGCASLTSVGIVGSGASIEIPNGVTRIGNSSFDYCAGLTSVEIPSGVTSIGGYAFRGCTSLANITINATTPPTLGNYAFDFTNNCPIYVPDASIGDYQTAWSTYGDRLKPISEKP